MFVASKLLAAITQPLFWLAVWWALALVLLSWRKKAATVMLWTGLIAMGGLGFQALPDALLRPLENRYPVPVIDKKTAGYNGMIVLGGSMDRGWIWQHRGQPPLNGSAERMTVPVALLRQHPDWELVFSGGEGRLRALGVTESDLAKAFYTEQGADMARIVFESRARTTRENAQRVAEMLGPRCQEKWLLVTSAWHMPRSMTEFEAAGCSVTPYPVDFMTGETTPWSEYSLAHSVVTWQTALHEWVGLLAYRLTR